MKVLAFLILAIALFFNSDSFAQTINSEFKPVQEIAQIKEGDLVEATLRFWPIENADLSQFKKLEKSVLFNAFYMAQVMSLGVSPNNADVVEMRALFIVKSAKPQSLFVFKYNEAPIEMRISDVKIQELKEKSQNYIILNQSLNSSYFLTMIVVIVAIVLIVGIFKRKAIIAFVKGLKPDDSKKMKKHYDEIFRTANKREDFELIYKEKEMWLRILENRAPAHSEFFKVLNQYQYKKDWSNEDYSEVRSTFDVIRRSFEK